jgi:hypothetical protein
MNTMRCSKKLAVVTLAVLAMGLVVSVPSHARGMGGHGSGTGVMTGVDPITARRSYLLRFSSV